MQAVKFELLSTFSSPRLLLMQVIDLGSSEFVQPGEEVRHAFGTVRYSSPEMANDSAGQKSDLWSAGVVMYQMLAGQCPFLKGKDEDTLAVLKKGPTVKFGGRRWKHISQVAVRLRYTCHCCSQHGCGSYGAAGTTSLTSAQVGMSSKHALVSAWWRLGSKHVLEPCLITSNWPLEPPAVHCKQLPTLQAEKMPVILLAAWMKGPAVPSCQAAQDCIRAMLHPNADHRPTASEVLRLPWLAQQAPDTAIDPAILHQLQLFANMSRARRLMLGVMAKSLSGTEASKLLRQFLAFDKDYNGTLDYKELSAAAKQVRSGIFVITTDAC